MGGICPTKNKTPEPKPRVGGNSNTEPLRPAENIPTGTGLPDKEKHKQASGHQNSAKNSKDVEAPPPITKCPVGAHRPGDGITTNKISNERANPTTDPKSHSHDIIVSERESAKPRPLPVLQTPEASQNETRFKSSIGARPSAAQQKNEDSIKKSQVQETQPSGLGNSKGGTTASTMTLNTDHQARFEDLSTAQGFESHLVTASVPPLTKVETPVKPMDELEDVAANQMAVSEPPSLAVDIQIQPGLDGAGDHQEPADPENPQLLPERGQNIPKSRSMSFMSVEYTDLDPDSRLTIHRKCFPTISDLTGEGVQVKSVGMYLTFRCSAKELRARCCWLSLMTNSCWLSRG